jgi:hypothetical protein
MSRAQIIYLHLAVFLTAITGAMFAVMKYWMKSDDPYAVANHPLQPHALSVHVLVAPLLVFGLGWVFGNHIWPKFQFGNGKNRATGVAAMLLIAPMTLSGYLIQIATSDAIRYAMSIAHWISSGLFVVIYAIHLIKPPGAEVAE